MWPLIDWTRYILQILPWRRGIQPIFAACRLCTEYFHQSWPRQCSFSALVAQCQDASHHNPVYVSKTVPTWIFYIAYLRTIGRFLSALSWFLWVKALIAASALALLLTSGKYTLRNASFLNSSRHRSGCLSMLRLILCTYCASGCHRPPPIKELPGWQWI